MLVYSHIHLWQIHFDIWQNQYNIVKLNKIKLKKRKKINNQCFCCFTAVFWDLHCTLGCLTVHQLVTGTAIFSSLLCVCVCVFLNLDDIQESIFKYADYFFCQFKFFKPMQTVSFQLHCSFPEFLFDLFHTLSFL